MKYRILAICAAAVLALTGCSTYHDTYHDNCKPTVCGEPQP